MEQNAGVDQARDLQAGKPILQKSVAMLQPSPHSQPLASPRILRKRISLLTVRLCCWQKAQGCGQSWIKAATSWPPSFCSSRPCG